MLEALAHRAPVPGMTRSIDQRDLAGIIDLTNELTEWMERDFGLAVTRNHPLRWYRCFGASRR